MSGDLWAEINRQASALFGLRLLLFSSFCPLGGVLAWIIAGEGSHLQIISSQRGTGSLILGCGCFPGFWFRFHPWLQVWHDSWEEVWGLVWVTLQWRPPRCLSILNLDDHFCPPTFPLACVCVWVLNTTVPSRKAPKKRRGFTKTYSHAAFSTSMTQWCSFCKPAELWLTPPHTHTHTPSCRIQSASHNLIS